MNRLMLSGNPLLQLAGLVVGAVVAVGAILLGAVVLAFILGAALIAGTAFYVRLWWLRRRHGGSGPLGGAPWQRRRGGARGQGRAQGRGSRPAEDIVEVEYTVIEERMVCDRDRDRDRDRG